MAAKKIDPLPEPQPLPAEFAAPLPAAEPEAPTTAPTPMPVKAEPRLHRHWEIRLHGRTVRVVQTSYPGTAADARTISDRNNDPLPADAEITPLD